MSHPYTDHYPSGPDINQRLSDHEKRIKELETKLGAVSDGRASEAREYDREQQRKLLADSDSEDRVAHSTAPSVSAVVWRGRAMAYRDDGYKSAADACDLAAAVTRACEPWLDTKRLSEIALAFVRGEPLPQKGG